MNKKIQEKTAALLKLQTEARALNVEMEADESKRTADNREKFAKMIEDGKAMRSEVTQLTDLDALSDGIEVAERKTVEDPRDAELGNGRRSVKSAGHKMIESADFKALAEGKAKNAVIEVKAILGETSLSGGETIRAERQPDIVALARQRPPSVIDLVQHLQTSLDSVDYVTMTGRTDNSAITAEGAASPEGDLSFATVAVAVKEITQWIKASKQILSDSPRLQGTIDGELTYMVRNKLENVIIADMLAASGIQSRVHQVSGRGFVSTDSVGDTLRRAMTDIRLEFYEADGVVLHPAQAEAMDTERGDDGHYVNIYDPVQQRVWRKPVVETPAMTSGTAIVSNFFLAYTVWDRMDAKVDVGYINDDFTKRLVTIMGILRAAYKTVRPKALEKITGM